MNILLVDNLVMPEEGSLALFDVHPHLGLLAVATAAEVAGHRVKIYDPKRAIRSGELSYDGVLYELIASRLLAMCPEVVGFTTLGCSFLFALNVAAILKRYEPDLPILLGGPHATMLHREILERFRQFDIVVRHEVDEIFASVLDKLDTRSFDRIPGISWRASERRDRLRFTEGKPIVENLDRLPIASYDHYPVSELHLDLLRIEAGRGCPFKCTFCSTASFFQRNFRLKSAGRLVEELDLLNAQYGFSDFKLDHDLFTVNRRKVLEFCEAVKGRGYRWRASARVDCVDKELLVRMAESGCVGLYFGIESGSVRMQEISQKRLDLSLVFPMLKIAQDVGIDMTASFITGFPEELESDQDETLDMLGRCFSPRCLTQLHMLAPEPGTPMFDKLRPNILYDGYGGRYNAELVGDKDEELILEHPEIFQTYYYYPAQMERSRYIFAVEAVDIFRRIGPIVLSYILRMYEGQLSKLVREFRLFFNSQAHFDRPDSESFELYVTSKFGLRHHITSLVRYALRCHISGCDYTFITRRASTFDASQLYRLSPQVHILSEVHDCGLLLKQISSQSESSYIIDESQTGELGVYLLKAGNKGAMNYAIDTGLQAILGLFEEPRTCQEVKDFLCAKVGVADIDMRFFEHLVRAEIIIPSAASTPATRLAYIGCL